MSWHENVETGIRKPLVCGAVALAIGFGGFGTWAAVVPLESAVIAPGKVTVKGNNKVVQHFEGGIVQDLLIEDGQHVRAGQILVALESTSVGAKLNRMQSQLTTLEVVEARVLAERDGLERLVFSEALLKKGRLVGDALDDQQSEFDAGYAKHVAEIAALEHQIAGVADAIAGRITQLSEARRQLELLAEEREALETLLEQGLTRKSQVLSLRRAESELNSRIGELQAAIGSGRQASAEIDEQIERARKERVAQASALLSDTRLKIADLREQIRETEDVLSRSSVRAPITGRVISLVRLNPGAVVAAGQELMQIVPEGAELSVDAHVSLQDIDEITVGQPARLVFPGLQGRDLPPLRGSVINVSADRLENPRTGEPFYQVRLRILPPAAAESVAYGIAPGNPVEVMMTTGQRTFLAYLIEPIARVFGRAAREG